MAGETIVVFRHKGVLTLQVQKLLGGILGGKPREQLLWNSWSDEIRRYSDLGNVAQSRVDLLRVEHREEDFRIHLPGLTWRRIGLGVPRFILSWVSEIMGVGRPPGMNVVDDWRWSSHVDVFRARIRGRMSLGHWRLRP